jgi:hypothetical protein
MDHTFETWIAHCFDHPAGDPAWHFDVDAPIWSAPPDETLAHLTRLFRALAPYSDAQINQGLWYIASAGSSDFGHLLADAAVPLADRVACVAAMTGLYDDLFAPRCAEALGHADDRAALANPLNSACYMWWDLLPLGACPGEPTRAALDAAALATMRHALGLASMACQESALHGLGHWASGYPAVVQAAIDGYLARPGVSPELRRYAQAARAGCVL